jgi:hypothetical protein
MPLARLATDPAGRAPGRPGARAAEAALALPAPAAENQEFNYDTQDGRAGVFLYIVAFRSFSCTKWVYYDVEA